MGRGQLCCSYPRIHKIVLIELVTPKCQKLRNKGLCPQISNYIHSTFTKKERILSTIICQSFSKRNDDNNFCHLTPLQSGLIFPYYSVWCTLSSNLHQLLRLGSSGRTGHCEVKTLMKASVSVPES